jgi:ring-1,2-phenylacetyl-CoA epoxidase subunit PaaD
MTTADAVSFSDRSFEQPSALEASVHQALTSVDDPEYPGLSIVDLGLVERVDAGSSAVTIGLIPTFSGCPALHMIAADVVAAVVACPDVTSCHVEWLDGPVWSTERMSTAAQEHLARDFTVVLRSKDGSLRCPVCGSTSVTDQSMAGPTRCRSIAWCGDCRNPVEVMR